MRGQGYHVYTSCNQPRITPADAGTSRGDKMLKQLPEDHPRGCGDKLSTVTAAISPLGSPPRMRGQAVRIQPVRSDWIPGLAGAGCLCPAVHMIHNRSGCGLVCRGAWLCVCGLCCLRLWCCAAASCPSCCMRDARMTLYIIRCLFSSDVLH